MAIVLDTVCIRGSLSNVAVTRTFVATDPDCTVVNTRPELSLVTVVSDNVIPPITLLSENVTSAPWTGKPRPSFTVKLTIDVSGNPKPVPVPAKAIREGSLKVCSIKPTVADATVTLPEAVCVVPFSVAVTTSEPTQP